MINLITKDILQIFKIKNYIETGCLWGESMNIVESWLDECPYLENIYEIDLWSKSIEESSLKVKSDKTHLICSNSVDWIKNNKLNEPIFFYLDAHADGNISKEQQDISNTYAPDGLLFRQEIKEILKLYKFPIISIDDWNAEYHLDQISDIFQECYVTEFPNKAGKYQSFLFPNRSRYQAYVLVEDLSLKFEQIFQPEKTI